MSIEISYTRHGTILIRCGKETVEVPLSQPFEPSAQKGTPDSDKDSIPPTKPAEHNESPKPFPFPKIRIGSPKGGPRVMAIITKDGLDTPDWEPTTEIELAIYKMPDYPLGIVMQIDELQRLAPRDIQKRLTRLRSQLPNIQPHVLEVVMSPMQTNQAIDVEKLRAIVADNQAGLSAIRLHFTPEIKT